MRAHGKSFVRKLQKVVVKGKPDPIPVLALMADELPALVRQVQGVGKTNVEH
jgi:hypothetical protein